MWHIDQKCKHFHDTKAQATSCDQLRTPTSGLDQVLNSRSTGIPLSENCKTWSPIITTRRSEISAAQNNNFHLHTTYTTIYIPSSHPIEINKKNKKNTHGHLISIYSSNCSYQNLQRRVNT